MNKVPTCTLSINVAVPDQPYLDLIIPHLVRACCYPFTQRMLIVDSAPLASRYGKVFTKQQYEQLISTCNGFKNNNIIDEVREVDYSKNFQKKVLKKHLGNNVWETHDFRGAPIYPYLFAYEAADSEYFLHFDSDILFHNSRNESWVTHGIKILKDNNDVLSATPLPGPPTLDGTLKQRDVHYSIDPRGFYSFKEFTSRRFLLMRSRFDKILPLNPVYLSRKQRFTSWFTRRSVMERWEQLVSLKLQKTKLIRADSNTHDAWTLHPLARGPEFIEELPSIIKKIESGYFPDEQRGDYELNFEAWTNRSASSSTSASSSSE